MRRSNEFAVGLTALLAALVIVVGAIALGRLPLGRRDEIRTARFRSVGGLGPGANVTLRGVKVGRVAVIRVAADDWVEADFRLKPDLKLPTHPAAIAAPATLFGEWRVNILAFAEAPSELVQQQLAEAAAVGGDIWPGTTLPDIGEITLQASRIAGDIGLITNRLGGALDSTAVADVRASLKDLRATVVRLTQMANAQTENLSTLTGNLTRASGDVDVASRRWNTVMGRVDSATMNGQLQDVVSSTQKTSAALRQMTADMQEIVNDVKEHRRSLVRVLTAGDSLLTRVQEGRGTLSLLASDSALYHEATGAVKQLRTLLADIQANPRRYFR
ncbi:MAG TPA: MlaD family protein, partial [Gemmatimonadales bacterium]|nr:MlaD family protein [Gemmatimonadales bacterium]